MPDPAVPGDPPPADHSGLPAASGVSIPTGVTSPAPIVPAGAPGAIVLSSTGTDGEEIPPGTALDAPMPPAAPRTITRLRRPPRVFRRLREWVQNRLLGLVAALGEFIALFAFVLAVILGAIFVLTNRIVNQQVMSPGIMGGSYAPEGKARYSASSLGQAFAIAFVDGLPAPPMPIAASGAAIPAVRPKLAEEARSENSARDALLAAAGGFQASADTKAALAAPILSGKLLANIQAAKPGAAAIAAIPTRAIGPPPTRSVPSPSPTTPPTATFPPTAAPSVSPIRTATVATTATQAPATAVPAPSATVPRTATPPLVVLTSTPEPPSPTVRPSATPVPPSATAPVQSPTAAGTSTAATSPTPAGGGTPTIPALPTVTAAPASPTTVAPPSPTVAVSPTSALSPTPRPPPSPTVTHTATLTPTSTPTPTPTRVGGPSPTALAVVDFSSLVAIPGQPIITKFPGIFSGGMDGSDTAPNASGTPAPLPLGAGGEYKRTLLFVNGGSAPIDFVSQASVEPAMAENPLWADPEQGLQLEIEINGMSRYLGPLDTTKAATPPYLERIPPNEVLSVGFRIFLPQSAGNAMSRQTVVFAIEFAITRY